MITCLINNLKSLNKEPTCFKNPNNPSYIDMFLMNRSQYFQNTSKTGISDFHKLVVTVLKMFYKKQNLNNAEFAEFHNEFLSVLNKYAPIKYKYIRTNNSSYMT